jgi:C-terminal processing protease CtpA/Prc
VIRWGVIKNKKIGYIGITDMNNFSNYVSPNYQNTNKFDSIYDQKKSSIEPLEQFKDEINGVEELMEKVMNDFRNIDTVIVDLRFNGGGYETVALKLLSFFAPQEKHILSIKAKTKNGFTPAQKIHFKACF